MATLTLVVPCYNEAGRLDPRPFLEFRLTPHELRFLMVNDGSADSTGAALAAMRAAAPDRIELLDLPANRGKAEAVRRGMLQALAARPDHVGYWDADLATPLAELPAFLEVLASRPAVQMVLGARVKLLGRSIQRRAWRHYLGRVFATAVAGMLRLPIYDTQCGAKVFRANAALAAALAEPFVSRWLFDVELLARFLGAWRRAGLDPTQSIHELPLRTWHDIGGSKLSGAAYLRAAAGLARVWWACRGDLAVPPLPAERGRGPADPAKP